MSKIKAFLPGLVLGMVVAMVAYLLSNMSWARAIGLSVLPLAIIVGILLGNFFYLRIGGLAKQCDPGLAFAKSRVLRLGIVLYGLRITFQQIAEVGIRGIFLDAVIVATVFIVSCWLGIRWLKLDPRTTMLIGAGSAICGAAAVLATEPVVRGRSSDAAVAVSTVVLFGTIAMFLYPLMYPLVQGIFDVSPRLFGIYTGATVHEVAQVVVAGKAVSEDAAALAVIVKMIRVMLLAPFLLLLSVFLARHQQAGLPDNERISWKQAIVIPWFAVYFILVAGLNSLQWLPATLVSWLVDLDTLLLAMAMAALGVHTHFYALRQAGAKAFLLAGCLFVLLVLGGGCLTMLLVG